MRELKDFYLPIALIEITNANWNLHKSQLKMRPLKKFALLFLMLQIFLRNFKCEMPLDLLYKIQDSV